MISDCFGEARTLKEEFEEYERVKGLAEAGKSFFRESLCIEGLKFVVLIVWCRNGAYSAWDNCIKDAFFRLWKELVFIIDYFGSWINNILILESGKYLGNQN